MENRSPVGIRDTGQNWNCAISLLPFPQKIQLSKWEQLSQHCSLSSLSCATSAMCTCLHFKPWKWDLSRVLYIKKAQFERANKNFRSFLFVEASVKAEAPSLAVFSDFKPHCLPSSLVGFFPQLTANHVLTDLSSRFLLLPKNSRRNERACKPSLNTVTPPKNCIRTISNPELPNKVLSVKFQVFSSKTIS